MKIAIYARKSRSSEKGESVQNQIDMCKSYANTHFENADFFVYKDEGFSGGTIDRPQFQFLLKELKKSTYDVLMCYRLDRISRNVSDFSSTLELLTKNEIGFVSIKENFDTTTPMGRAMIHISSVFAQLERETIAERVRDNMLALARTGRWLGGTAPTGFKGKREAYYDDSGKKKFSVKLSPVAEEQELVKLLFDKYIELGSLAQVETFCMQNDIKSRNGKNMQPQTISMIIQNPVYCVGDTVAYEYFTQLGADVVDNKDEYDGTYGIMPYNRFREGKQHNRKDYDDWIIALGKHKGIIPSEKYIKAQKMIQKNRDKAIRSERPGNALLTGLMFCKICGSKMLVVGQDTLADGTPAYTYKCSSKHISRGVKCTVKNVTGHHLDKQILNNLKEMLTNKTGLAELLEKERKNVLTEKNTLTKDKTKIESVISKNENAIKILIMKLVEFSDDPTMGSYIQEQVDNLHQENEKLKKELLEIEQNSLINEIEEINWDIVYDSLLNFNTLIENQDILGKRKLIKDIVKRIEWDGEKIDIHMYTDKLDGD